MLNIYVDISRVNAKRIEIKYITSELGERDIWIEVGAFNIYKRREKEKLKNAFEFFLLTVLLSDTH